eukprot:588511-Prorocentrum_minimum.AAC.1
MRLQEPIETVLSNPHPSEALKSNIAPKKRCDAVRQHDASTKSDIPEPRTSGEGDRDEEDRDKEARAERRDAGDRAAGVPPESIDEAYAPSAVYSLRRTRFVPKPSANRRGRNRTLQRRSARPRA